MRLITLVIAMLGAAALLAGLLGGRLTRAHFERGLMLTAVALALVLVGNNAWSTSTHLLDVREANAKLTGQAATTAGGRHIGVQADFVEWARSHLRPGDSYYLMPSGYAKAGEGSYQWTTFRLLPHVSTTRQEEADVLVFYGVRPRATGYDRGDFEAPVLFSPEFAIARRRSAG